MTISITVAKSWKGDDEVHVAGCSHLKIRRNFQPEREWWGTFSGDSIYGAIREADSDMAAAFGEKVYDDPTKVASQPWTVAVMKHAPCFVKSLPAELRFDRETGEPMIRFGA